MKSLVGGNDFAAVSKPKTPPSLPRLPCREDFHLGISVHLLPLSFLAGAVVLVVAHWKFELTGKVEANWQDLELMVHP